MLAMVPKVLKPIPFMLVPDWLTWSQHASDGAPGEEPLSVHWQRQDHGEHMTCCSNAVDNVPKVLSAASRHNDLPRINDSLFDHTRRQSH